MNRRQLLAAACRVPAPLWVVLLCALLLLPNLGFVNLREEEGRNAFMAYSFLRDGDWLVPQIFGEAWRERPQLYAWLIAGLGWLVGGIDEWVIRLPGVLAVLAGALLIQGLVARHAGAVAGLCAAGFWLLCPFVVRHMAMGEPDLLLSVLSFAAFVVWWRGRARGQVAWWRWLLCGLLLAGVAAAKGPQQVGFFVLGAFAYTVLRRHWRDLPGLIGAALMPAALLVLWAWAAYRPGVDDSWLVYMRLDTEDRAFPAYLWNAVSLVPKFAVDALPAIVLAVPVWWRAVRGRSGADREVALALLLQATVCTAVLVVWPDARTRYGSPVFPAVAASAGLLVPELLRRREQWWRGLRWLVFGGLAGLAAYRVAMLLVVMPIWPDRFDARRQAAAAITERIRADPAPFVILRQNGHTTLWYARPSPQAATIAALGADPAGAWLILERGRLDEIRGSVGEAAVGDPLDIGNGLLLLRVLPEKAAP